VNKSTAKELMESLLNLNASINSVASEIEKVDSDDERRALRRSVAGLIDLVYTDFMRPIIREYPELDPDV
jgi:hypothetical protein